MVSTAWTDARPRVSLDRGAASRGRRGPEQRRRGDLRRAPDPRPPGDAAPPPQGRPRASVETGRARRSPAPCRPGESSATWQHRHRDGFVHWQTRRYGPDYSHKRSPHRPPPRNVHGRPSERNGWIMSRHAADLGTVLLVARGSGPARSRAPAVRQGYATVDGAPESSGGRHTTLTALYYRCQGYPGPNGPPP